MVDHYNNDLCQERHKSITLKQRATDEWLEKLDNRLYGLLVLAVAQLIGILALIVAKM